MNDYEFLAVASWGTRKPSGPSDQCPRSDSMPAQLRAWRPRLESAGRLDLGPNRRGQGGCEAFGRMDVGQAVFLLLMRVFLRDSSIAMFCRKSM